MDKRFVSITSAIIMLLFTITMGGSRMILAGHQTMLNPKESYPWDYRVEYFQITTTYPLFECGPLKQYNANWTDELITDASSALQSGIRNGLKFWSVFTFPQAATVDQKICGTPGTSTVYPYSGRYNFGGINSWFTQPTTTQTASIVQTNTLTRGCIESLGSDTIKYNVTQGSQSWEYSGYSIAGKKFAATQQFPILLYHESGSYQLRNVSVGTRFYECGFDFNIPGNLELHLRFVPCVKDNVQYICEMYSKTLIPNTMSGTVTSGPQVKDNYDAWLANNT